MPRDDLGHPVDLDHPPRRIVSLVPSITEAVAATVPDRLVGATDWCTHPADLDVARVRGTKNPDRRAITALRPDLVIANQEENRRLDVERLRADGVAVWVTRIETLEEAFASLHRLFEVALGVRAPAWLTAARVAWQDPPVGPPRRAAVAVWRDPWLVVGPRTFTGDLLARFGFANVFEAAEGAEGPDRYPATDPAAITARRPDVVVLPDEPYVFGPDDGPEAFPDVPTALVAGRLLTWYGPSLVTARDELAAALDAALSRR